jgi:hypothetical protein
VGKSLENTETHVSKMDWSQTHFNLVKTHLCIKDCKTEMIIVYKNLKICMKNPQISLDYSFFQDKDCILLILASQYLI